MLKNIIVSIIILLFASFLQITKAEASEGIVELASRNGLSNRCFAMSTLVNRSTNFLLTIQCRNLIYPVEPTGMFYILWSNPIGVGKDSNPLLIGDISYGNVSFNVNKPFSGLFITREQTKSPKQPSNDRVMQGSIRPISFLDREPTPTIIPSPTIKQTPTTGPSPTIDETSEMIQIVTPTPQPKSSGVTFFSVMRTFGILLIFIFIFAIVLYVINKIRR